MDNTTHTDSKMAFLRPLHERVDRIDMWVDRKINGFPKDICGYDHILSHVCVFLTHKGSARVLYDMHETTLHPNELSILLPGHVIQFVEFSDDFVFSRALISKEMAKELQFHIFSHDMERFHIHPLCRLNEIQMERVTALGTIFSAIVEHSYEDLPLRRKMLLSQLAVGFEFINYYRREQDKQWSGDRSLALFARFRDLVVAHYTESREVQYYAKILKVHPYHLTRVIREVDNGRSPAEWIEQYVIKQAKQQLESPDFRSLKEIAYMLGFSEPSSFYRYFKHATGMTAKEYRTLHGER